jgi:hypothetical protein
MEKAPRARPGGEEGRLGTPLLSQLVSCLEMSYAGE